MKDFSYSNLDDALVASGEASVSDCDEYDNDCRGFIGAIVKLDAQTGQPVPGFGTNGIVLIPRNFCESGEAPPLAGSKIEPFPRCRVAEPKVKAKFTFSHVRSRRPAVRGIIQLTRSSSDRLFVDRKVTLTLPRKLGLRRGQVRRHLKVSYLGAEPLAQSVRVKGRKIVVASIADVTGTDPPYDEALELRMTLNRGALKFIPKKSRRSRLSFRTEATYTPTPFGSTLKWNGPSKTAASTTRVRPQKTR